MTLYIESFNGYHLMAIESNPDLDSYGDTYPVMEEVIPQDITIVELIKLVHDKFPTCRKLVFAF